MARILLFFLILNSASLGKAQVGFSNTYDFGTPFARSANLIVEEDSLWLSGVTSTPDIPYQQVFFFSRLDSFGQVLTLNTFADSLGDAYVMHNFVDVAKKVSDGFLLVGKVFFRGGGILIKLDEMGLPNPAGKAVVLDTGLGGGATLALLEMHNSQGQLALSRKLTLAEGRAEVDISRLAEGWYTVRLLSGAGLQAGRLVVQR